MSAPAEPTPSEPMRWFEPLIGLIFGTLVLAGVAVATYTSYDDGDDAHAVVEDDGHEVVEDDGH